MATVTKTIDRIVSMDTQRVDFVAQLALFLQEKTGSVCGCWEDYMRAADQRALFGRYLGKGIICIDGDKETISMRVKVGFGQDYDYRKTTRFADLHQFVQE